MNTRYHGLTIKQIIEQLNIDQFIRLCTYLDEKHGKGSRFDVLAVRPFRNNKDCNMLAITIMLSSTRQVRTLDLPEKV